MKRVHFATMKKDLEGVTVLTLVEPGYDDKQMAKKGAKELEPGTYYLIAFDSPEPVIVAPPPVATRNVAKFGKPFVERKTTKSAKADDQPAKPKPRK